VTSEGDRDGIAEGDLDGFADGEGVGILDGEGVGTAVGAVGDNVVRAKGGVLRSMVLHSALLFPGRRHSKLVVVGNTVTLTPEHVFTPS